MLDKIVQRWNYYLAAFSRKIKKKRLPEVISLKNEKQSDASVYHYIKWIKLLHYTVSCKNWK